MRPTQFVTIFICLFSAAAAQPADEVIGGRQLGTQLQNIEDLVARGNYPVALSQLQDLIERSGNQMATIGKRRQSVNHFAAELFRKLPQKARDVYQQQVGATARQQLTEALTANNYVGVRSVLEKYLFTQAGLDALRSEFVRVLDRGDWETADLLAERICNHIRSNSTIKRRTANRLIHSTLQFEMLSLSRTMFDRYSQHLDESSRKQLLEQVPNLATLAETKKTLVPDTMPSSLHEWAYDQSTNLDLILHKEGMRELEKNGIASLPIARPVFTHNRIIIKLKDGIAGLNLVDGREVWKHSPTDSPAASQREPKLMNVPDFRARFRDTLIQRQQIDTVFGTLTNNGSLVYSIVGVKGSVKPQGTPFDAARHPVLDGSSTTKSQLLALDATTGKVAWTQSAMPTNNDWPISYFFGPPCVHNDRLFAVVEAGQSQSILYLSVWDAASGRFLWNTRIARMARDLTQDRVRRLAACPVVVDRSVAFCPTGAGSIVAVDLFDRTPIWSYHYSRDDTSSNGRQFLKSNRLPRHQWWKSWRQIDLFCQSNVVAFVSPESQLIHALNRETGELLWSKPRESRLYLAGILQNRLIVVGKNRVEAIDPKTGAIAWTCPISTPTGRGFATDSHYVVSTVNRQHVAINLQDGTRFHTDTRFNANIEPISGGFVIQGNTRVARLPTIADALKSLRARPKSRERFLLEAYTLKQRRDLDGAVAAYFAALREPANGSSTDDAQIRQSIIESMLRILEERPQTWRDIRQELLTPDLSVQQRINVMHQVALAAGRVSRYAHAVEMLLELRQLDPIGMKKPSTWAAQHRIRFDRLLQGELQDFVDASTDGESARRIDQFLAKHAKAQDPFALQRLADRFSQLSWGQRLRLDNPRETSIGIPFHQQQLRLLEIAGSHDPAVSSRAIHQLGDLYLGHSYNDDAAAMFRQLAATDKQTSRRLASLPSHVSVTRSVEHGPQSPWPQQTPKVVEREQQNNNIYYLPIPIRHQLGTQMSQINAFIERGGRRKLRFMGAGQTGFWSPPDLPQSRSPFRYLLNLYDGWSFGHLLILKIGTELFAYTPINENGEPRATMLWTRQMASDSAWESYQTIPSPMKFGPPETIFLNKAGHAIGRIVAVTASYICYQSDGMLTAIETATGARLWEVWEPSVDLQFGGDEQFVFFKGTKKKSIRLVVRRALDGKLQKVHQLPEPPDIEWLIRNGSRWVGFDPVASRLIGVDVINEQILWRQEFELKAMPFAVNQGSIGVLEPSGFLQLLSIQTGDVLCRYPVKLPKPVKKIYGLSDARRAYVMVSGQISDPKHLAVRQVRDGFRNSWVSGTLCAIELFPTPDLDSGLIRPVGTMTWQRELIDVAFAQDQLATAPFLVLHYRKRRPGADDGKLVDGVVELIDKATGQTLFESAGSVNNVNYDVYSNPAQSWLDFRNPRRSVRIDYSKEDSATKDDE